MRYDISFHFDGTIIEDHKITARTLGKTLTHLQRAIDKAYIETLYGKVEKNSRLSGKDYANADFITGTPRDGGYILDLFSKSDIGKKTCNKIIKGINDAYTDALKQESDQESGSKLHEKVLDIRSQVKSESLEPIPFEQIAKNESSFTKRSYGERLICREIDGILSIIRASSSGDSTFEIDINGDILQNFSFDRSRSQRFHSIVSERHLGPPTIYNGFLREMDADNQTGRFVNQATKKKSILYFSTIDSFMEAKDFLGNSDHLHFVGCPFVEYDAYDISAGDIYYISPIKNG